MKTVSRLGSATDRSASSRPPRSAARTMRGISRSRPLHVQLEAAVDQARASHALDVGGQQLGEPCLRRPAVRTVTTVSAPMLCLSAAGVSSARILP